MATLRTRIQYVSHQNNVRANGTSWSSKPRQGRPNVEWYLVGKHKGSAKTRIYRAYLDFDLDRSFIGFLHKAELVFYTDHRVSSGIGSDPKVKVFRNTNNFPLKNGNVWNEDTDVNPGIASSIFRNKNVNRTNGGENRVDVTPLVGRWLQRWQRWRRADGHWVAGNGYQSDGFTIRVNNENAGQVQRWAFHSDLSSDTAKHPILVLTYEEPNQPPNYISTISPAGTELHGTPFTGEFADPENNRPEKISLIVRKAGNQNTVWNPPHFINPGDWDDNGGIFTWEVPNPGSAWLKGNKDYEWRAKGFDHGGKDSGWTAWRAFRLEGSQPTVSLRPTGTLDTMAGQTFRADWGTDGSAEVISWQAQLKSDGDLWGDLIWDELFTPLTQSMRTNQFVEFPYKGPNLDAGTYQLRVQVWDSRGISSEWSNEVTVQLVIGSQDDNDQGGEGQPPYTAGFKREHTPVRIILRDVDGPNRGPGTVKAVIEDAHNIGMSAVVNEPGEFFFTLTSTHPQAGECEPFQRHYDLQQYRRGNWVSIANGILTDFDAGENDIVIYGLDYIGMLSRTIDTRFPQEGANLHLNHAKGGAKYRDEKISDIIIEQLNDAAAQPDAPLGFFNLGIIQSLSTRVSIFSSFKQRLDFMRGLIASHRQGSGSRTRLKARRDPSQADRWEWDLRHAPGIDRDDLRMEYGSTLQNFRVIGMGEDYTTRAHGVGTEPNSVKPKYFIWPPENQSDFLTQTFGSLQRVEVWPDLADMNDLKRRVKQMVKESSKVGKRMRLAIRVHSIDPFDGYDLTDNIPIDIERGLVETERYGSGYWTLWGLEWRVYPDGHDEVTFAVKPREDDELPDDDLIPSNPVHQTPEWFFGSGPPPDCSDPVEVAMAVSAAVEQPAAPCECLFYFDDQTGIVYERPGPDYDTWTERSDIPAIPPPPGGWYPGDFGPPAKVANVVALPFELQQPDGGMSPSIEVSWDAGVETDLQGYEIQTVRTGELWANPLTRMVGKDETTVLLDGLVGNTSHDIRVRAHDMEGYVGEWSDVATTTAPGDTIPPDIMEVPTLNPGYKLLAVTWTPVSDIVLDAPAVDIDFYQVRGRRQSDLVWSQPMQTKGTLLVYNDLDYDETYDIQVRAVDRSGNVNDGAGGPADHALEASAELGWSEFVSAQPLDIGSADAGFDTVVANIVQATEISADQITAGDLVVGKPGNAGTIRIYNENGQPIGAWGDFGLVSADPNNPTRAIWRAPDGSMKFTDEYDWDGIVAIETGIDTTAWTTAIDWSGINAEAITFGAAGGGNNRLFNAGFELQAFVGADEVVEQVWTETADWQTATGQVNLNTAGAELRMTKEP